MKLRAANAAPGFRADVEGLRAVAVLLVLADHLLGGPAGGYVGVDVFFVVSGYLITGLLVRELLATGRLRFRAFYARRVRRLLPAALTVLAVTTVATQLLFLPVRAAQSATDALWAALFAANWRFASLGTDYFASTRPPSPVQHYWSLAVEEQFYLVWPAVLLAVAATVPAVAGRSRTGPVLPVALLRRRLTAVLGALAGASLAWSVWLTATSPQTAYFSTAARTVELAAGALLALHAERLARLPARVAYGLSSGGLAGIALAAVVLSPTTPFPGAAALLPVLATCAVLAAGSGPQLPPPSRLLALPVPRYVGRISYSLYLWHWPVLVLATALAPGTPGWVLVPVSLGLAAASHALVEEPLRRRRPAGRRRVVSRWAPLRQAALPGVLAVSLLTISLSAGGALAPGDVRSEDSSAAGLSTTVLPNGDVAQREPSNAWRTVPGLEQEVQAALTRTTWGRLDPPLEALEGAAAPEWVSDDCLDVFPERQESCVFGSGDKTAVLLGDSVAISWLPGLRAALEPQGYRIHVLTRRQCSLGAPDGAVSPGCRTHLARVLEVARTLQPELVLVSGSYRAAARALEPEDAPAWQRQLTARLRPLAAPGRRVVVLGAPPQSGNLQSCATRVSRTTDCVRELADVWTALAEADRAGAAAAGARYVDVRDWFCADDRCPPVLDGTPVAFDGTHLTAAHSRRLALLLRQTTLA